MPDICMCKGEGCSAREHCYRYKATPCEFRQSYFVNSPIEGGKCVHFWPTNEFLEREKDSES